MADTTYLRFQSRFHPEQHLHIEHGAIEAGVIQPDWWSAMWTVEPVEGPFFRLRNRWKPELCLDIGSGLLDAAQVPLEWWSAMWRFVDADPGFSRLQNRWKPEVHVHNETGPVSAGPVQPGWWSAQWIVETVAAPAAQATATGAPADAAQAGPAPAGAQWDMPLRDEGGVVRLYIRLEGEGAAAQVHVLDLARRRLATLGGDRSRAEPAPPG